MTSNLRKHNYTGLVASSRAVLSLQPSCIQPDQDPFPTLSDEITTVRKELENLRWTVCSDMDCVKAHQRGRMRSPRYKHLLRGCRTESEGWENQRQTVAVPGRSATASVPKLLKEVPRLEKDLLRGNGDVPYLISCWSPHLIQQGHQKVSKVTACLRSTQENLQENINQTCAYTWTG